MSDTLAEALESAVCGVSRDWKKAKRRADKQDRVSRHDLARLRYQAPARVTVREAAFRVMQRAYALASSNGRYYANARQIMYAARPLVLEITGGDIWKDSAYFTQQILKDYLEDWAPDWKVVWDSRGHLTEPHTGKVIGLGGAEVMRYTQDWTGADFELCPSLLPRQGIATVGPGLRFGAVLFIEKEGFDEILRDARIGERHDMAIMSTKGLPVGAACNLAARLSFAGVKILVLHDFDLAGLKIVKTLRLGARLAQGSPVVDIGLRLADVTGLQSEPVVYKQRRDPRLYLRQCGATEAECSYLVRVGDGGWRGHWSGERVELNAMTSEQLITWLEGKLKAHGVARVVPDAEVLANAYRRACFVQEVDAQTEKIRERIAQEDTPAPAGLDVRVKELLEGAEVANWDAAIWHLAALDRARVPTTEDDPAAFGLI